ncbi:MAG: hypothetical protein ACI392_01755 [Paludibacteraceae bacterium]
MKKIAFFMCCLCAALFMSCTKTTGTENGHDWVDLGLPSGTKWATCNVGASTPEEYGDYFAWGETETKSTYDRDTYKWIHEDKWFHHDEWFHEEAFIKYNTDAYSGKVDNKTVLDPEDDAAHANWGGAWRMPTDPEWTELRENCEWTWTTLNGVNGYEVKSKTNGNSIFLPAAGFRYGDDFLSDYGNYWSSSLAYGSGCACNVLFVSDYLERDLDYGGRCNGQSVRPVFK